MFGEGSPVATRPGSWWGKAVVVLVAVEVVLGAVLVGARSRPTRATARARPPAAFATATVESEAPSSAPPPSSVLFPPPGAPAVLPPPPRPAAPLPPDPAGRLRGRLDAALAGVGACMVVKDGDSVLYSREPDTPLVPASTQKLLVAAAALSRLGPEFRFDTKVVAPAPPRADGSVDALWLVGSGDPLLATPEYAAHVATRVRTRETPTTALAALADGLVQRGVRTARDGIHGDDSRYEGLRYLPSWKPSYRTEPEVGPLGALTVDGGLEQWEPKEVPTVDPAAHAVAALSRLLASRGVKAGAAGDGSAPPGAVTLAELRSAPLGQVVASMLRSSDNLTAELLLRELDREAGGSGTTAGGTRVVTEEATRLGLATGAMHMVDGSGLDTGNRASCALLLGVLGLTGRARFGPIADGLAVAGQTGTLASRYGGTPVAGRLAAKTGSIDCAAGMVGRLEITRPITFAFLANGVCTWALAEGAENRMVSALATYPG